MESRLRVLLLITALAALPGCSTVRGWLDRDEPQPRVSEVDQAVATESEDADQPAPRVIEPEVERRVIKVPKIDTENFEIGGVFGSLSIEDFGSNNSYGLRAAYHITE